MFSLNMHGLNISWIKKAMVIEIVNEYNGKPNKLRVDHGREFYNKLM